MTARRAVLILTCLLLAGLGVYSAVARWDDANRIATIAASLAAVAAVGVGIWAALPANRQQSAVSRSGKALARGRGSTANTGISGAGSSPSAVTGSGDAHATDGGQANTGVDQP